VGKDLDWVDYFDQAYYNAVVHGTGFIRISVNGPEGLNLSVVDPKDYRYLMEEPPSTWTGLTPEEEEEIITKAHSGAGWRFYIRETEAKLKAKNAE
jgi:hypothetical protein